MSQDLLLMNSNKIKCTKRSDVDGFITFILAVMLAVMPFFLQKYTSIGILSFYLLSVTVASRIKLRTLFISGASYLMIVLIPYFFGLFMNNLFYIFSNNGLFINNQGAYEIFLRLFRLFIIWFVSILYFHTTPIETVLGMLDKFLTPLKFVGVPVADYLKVIMCTVIELKETGMEAKKHLEESMRSAMAGSGGKPKINLLKINIKGISQIIVSLIVNSFEKLDQVEHFVENVDPDDLYCYHFKVSKRDTILILSFILFTSLVFLVEKGYWLNWF